MRNQVAELVGAYRELNRQHQELCESHEVSKDGTRALLRFVSSRHRLGDKIEPGSLRELLQNSDLRGK